MENDAKKMSCQELFLTFDLFLRYMCVLPLPRGKKYVFLKSVVINSMIMVSASQFFQLFFFI